MSEFFSPTWEDDKRFNINWRAFGLISIVMTGLVLCFLLFMAQWNEQRFETDRQTVHLKHQVQLERLIEASAENMIQLSSAVSFNKGLMNAVSSGDDSSYAAALDALDWNLQTDSGINVLGLFNISGINLFEYGELGHKTSVAQVVENEQPFWKIDCDETCRIVTYTALLHQGEMSSVLVLAEPLSNVMLRFQRVANINTGLLSHVGQLEKDIIPAWQRSLVALTNPEESKQVLKQASKDYSLEELREGIGLIAIDDSLYELKAMPIQDNQVVVISDVSNAYQALHKSKDRTMQMSAGALVLAEVFLLIFLWRPLKKIKMSEQLEGFVVKQAEMLKEKSQALSKAQSLSESLCDSISAAVLMIDDEGRIKHANGYFIKLLGLPSSQIESHRFNDFIIGEGINLKRRVSDVMDGLIDEYEAIGRVSSFANETHKMIWRFVPSYYCERVSWENSESTPSGRHIIAIGMPLTLPTLEHEQEWINSRDPETGVFNRLGMYGLLSDALQELKSDRVLGDQKMMLTALRFDSALFQHIQAARSFASAFSTFSSRLERDFTEGQFKVARLDRNEIVIFSRVGNEVESPVLAKSYEEMITSIAKERQVELGSFQVTGTELTTFDQSPEQIIQRVQSYFRNA